MSVNTKMTAIADKIRSLRGVSGTMGLDAMATHLDNEITGLNAALAALTEKGVTVPDGTKVDGLAALIAAIESGGSGDEYEVSEGSFTTADATSDIEVEHGLSASPEYICIVNTRNDSTTNKVTYMKFMLISTYLDNMKRPTCSGYWSAVNTLGTYMADDQTRSSMNNFSTNLGYYVKVNNSVFGIRQSSIKSTYGIGAGETFKFMALRKVTQ